MDEYLGGFEKLSRSAVALTKTLLYQTDGMAFTEALETGVDVNVIARMTEDCQQGHSPLYEKAVSTFFKSGDPFKKPT